MSCMSPCELVAFVTSVACSIAKCCSDEEIGIIAAVFVQLGDTLETIAVQKERCETGLEENNTNI